MNEVTYVPRSVYFIGGPFDRRRLELDPRIIDYGRFDAPVGEPCVSIERPPLTPPKHVTYEIIPFDFHREIFYLAVLDSGPDAATRAMYKLLTHYTTPH